MTHREEFEKDLKNVCDNYHKYKRFVESMKTRHLLRLLDKFSEEDSPLCSLLKEDYKII